MGDGQNTDRKITQLKEEVKGKEAGYTDRKRKIKVQWMVTPTERYSLKKKIKGKEDGYTKRTFNSDDLHNLRSCEVNCCI